MQTLLQEISLKLDANVFNKYKDGLTNKYLNDFPVATILEDIKAFEELTNYNKHVFISVSKYLSANNASIRLYSLNEKISLSRSLPIIENFGFSLIDETVNTINTNDGHVIHICDFSIEANGDEIQALNNEHICQGLSDALVATFDELNESDKLNQLVVKSQLNSKQVMLFRAISKYASQTNLPFSYDYINLCLVKHNEISANLFKLFEYKFCPIHNDKNTASDVAFQIKKALTKVASIDEDKILQTILSIVKAMLRTNYFQRDENDRNKEYISFKLESAKVLNLPKPIPLYEIFVYSKSFEAIHLRGGKVARGGLRWSDRPEDFRTEVLGLVKAQIVKNSVIVPTGSKGGFVCKKLPSITNREEYMTEGIRCYKLFISGLLDITDNLIAGKIIKPQNVVCLDGDDPYLVVAADKGTATFSDFANQVSIQYNFWLNDAFASGGSAGYDHKKMGITAKGAWESVKRHFRHLGVNTQQQDFTVIGIGDLMGDVFGNGMLLSKHIKLIAAFNHQHIFLDPNPDTGKSYNERVRMFNLPRSSWEDYDKSIISNGGGIYLRSSKTIKLTKEVQAWLEISETELAPNVLINLILKAKADLLYNGGIGTYIKAQSQSNEEVRDKANDELRVNGNELQVKVVGEGGNLGATQLGRIEYANNGGNIYTDAIDNSAGVDCSDHEVNIKILYSDIMHKTGLSIEERNKELESMTSDISRLVLQDNYLQTQALETARTRALYTSSQHGVLIRKLEEIGLLDRKVEFLPSEQEFVARREKGVGLSAPEMSVLLAYSKISIDQQIKSSGIITRSDFDELLLSYFPKLLQEKYPEYIKSHYLRKEIIATMLSNLIVNRAGITFISRFKDEFNSELELIIQAWWVAYNLLNAEKLFQKAEALDNVIDADAQVSLFIGIEKSVERLCRWLIRYSRSKSITVVNSAELIKNFAPKVAVLEKELDKIIQLEDYPDVAKVEKYFQEKNVPYEVYRLISRRSYIPQIMDIVLISTEHNLALDEVATNYYKFGRVLQIDWLRMNVLRLPRNNKWQILSRSALASDVYGLYRKIMLDAITSYSNEGCFFDNWMARNEAKVEKLNQMFDELQGYQELDLAMISAAIREFANIVN